MAHEKFNLTHLERLNDPARLEQTPPLLMWEALGCPDARTIIEIGAGTGLFASRFAELAPEAIVYAVDIEPSMVRWMLQNLPLSECDRLRPLLGKETVVPLATGEADVVVMLNVHHELASPLDSYREAIRLLRIGGQILVADWLADGLPDGPPARVRATAEQIAELLTAVGFEDVISHPGFERHSLLTARKPAVCSL
jgi:SAM-dependent methyltransferase